MSELLPQEEKSNDLNLAGENKSEDHFSAIIEEPNKQDMEVHSHVHSGHGKKTWKEYLWEFLMLFLAVFCGFLAEYQLEHYIEKQRANEFAMSLKRDILADTTNFNTSINSLNLCINKIDTLITFLNDEKETPEYPSTIYRLSVYAFVFPGSFANESTLQQLLNSGSLRYFKVDSLVQSIKLYNQYVHLLDNNNTSVSDFNIEFRKVQVKFVEINPILKFINHNNFLNGASHKIDAGTDFFSNEKLLTTDRMALKEYMNWCALKKFYMENSLNRITKVKQSSIQLLEILNREFG